MDGEFARLLGWVAELALRGLVGGLLISLPVVATVALVKFHRLPHLRAYWQVAMVTVPALLAGVVTGWIVLYADPYSPSFRIASIFQVDGPWDVRWTTFLLYRADPAIYSYDPLLWIAQAPDTRPELALVLLFVGCLLVLAVVGVLIYLRGLDLAAGLLGVAFLFLFAQAVTIYMTALFAYTLNALNFWAALVALAILQYFRRRASHGGH